MSSSTGVITDFRFCQGIVDFKNWIFALPWWGGPCGLLHRHEGRAVEFPEYTCGSSSREHSLTRFDQSDVVASGDILIAVFGRFSRLVGLKDCWDK